jgi:membrane-associated phospholipid phosphatase
MLEALLQTDYALFRWVNQSLSNPVFDAILPWCRERLTWIPLYIILLVLLYQSVPDWRRLVRIIITLALTIALADTISSEVIKKNMQRLRPCRHPETTEHVQLRVASCGGGYSFTSSHATNHFAVAVYIGMVMGQLGRKRMLIWLIAWASLISFSQVYVGLHFPLDVLCGALLGATVGFLFFRTLKWG